MVAGGLLLAFNLGWLPESYKPLVFSWPTALIALGFFFIALRAGLIGLLLLGIGLYLFAGRLGYPLPDYRKLALPALLMVIGSLYLIRSRKRPWQMPTSKRVVQNGVLDESNIFGGSRQQLRDEVFRGGTIQCVFGGSELDLTQTTLPEGITYLDVRCVFGGITLTVPTSWNVQLQTQSLFGAFVEEDHPPRDTVDESRSLIIRGSCIIGGGEVRYRDCR